MESPFGSRRLLVLCGAMVIVLAALAVVQYQWSTRVASADAQREKEHLEGAASLFGDNFNAIAGDTVAYLQNQGEAALQSGTPLSSLPKLVAELYYMESEDQGSRRVKRLTTQGVFEPAAAPSWLAHAPCAELVLAEPPALVMPIREVPDQADANVSIRIEKAGVFRTRRCFAARLDDAYLHALLAQLIRQSFGATSAAEYDFAVTSEGKAIYGTPGRTEVRRAFFSVPPVAAGFARSFLDHAGRKGNEAIVVRQQLFVSAKEPGSATWLGPGAWKLQIARKGMPLTAAFEETRRRNLLFSAGMELLLLVAIAFLVAAARRMERLADQKMRFVAGVSHELRTPVSAIAMLSRNQADGLVTGADRVKQYGELIHQQSRRLNEMVEQTLQYAGIRSGRTAPSKSAVDLERLIEELVEARRSELAERGFKVEVTVEAGLPEIQGDPQWLRTAIDNLLSNAEKHADGGHWIRVSAGYIAPEKEVRISVEDRGGGIDPADQAEIFEPFSRGRAAIEAQIPGSGLGLSLVRSAVEAHRGSVTLVSRPGHGSTFTLHLPV